jgi:hypothetical protein
MAGILPQAVLRSATGNRAQPSRHVRETRRAEKDEALELRVSVAIDEFQEPGLAAVQADPQCRDVTRA